MNNYKNAHRWLLIALAIVILGFVRSYWSKFPNVEFGHHLHLLSATAWFALMIWQPRLATTGRLAQHRRNGMIGLFLAGAVVASALLMLPGNIEGALEAGDESFVNNTFLYGITFFDLVTILGFAGAVIMAILRSKQTEVHAIWMLSTVFWIIGPAFGRLMVMPVVMLSGGFDGLTFFHVMWYVTPLVLIAIGITAWRLKNWHPALWLAAMGNLSVYVSAWIGDAPWWRAFCEAWLLPLAS